LNLHAFWALDPKSNASANSAIPARAYFNRYTIFACITLDGPRILIDGMSNQNSKLMAILLFALIVAVSMAGQEVSPMMAAPVHPGGCHQHGAKPPASAPVSYRCCQQGHESAMPQSSFASQLSQSRLVSSVSSLNPPIAAPRQGSLQVLTVSSPDPPHLVPLRV
jgi:hypothetical protein